MSRPVTGGVAAMREMLAAYMKDAEEMKKVATKAGDKVQAAFERGRIDAYKHALAIMHQ